MTCNATNVEKFHKRVGGNLRHSTLHIQYTYSALHKCTCAFALQKSTKRPESNTQDTGDYQDINKSPGPDVTGQYWFIIIYYNYIDRNSDNLVEIMIMMIILCRWPSIWSSLGWVKS